jgi:hypothetical protein
VAHQQQQQAAASALSTPIPAGIDCPGLPWGATSRTALRNRMGNGGLISTLNAEVDLKRGRSSLPSGMVQFNTAVPITLSNPTEPIVDE